LNKIIYIVISILPIIILQGCKGENNHQKTAKVTFQESKIILERDYKNIKIEEAVDSTIIIKYKDRAETISKSSSSKGSSSNQYTQNSTQQQDYLIDYKKENNPIILLRDKTKNMSGIIEIEKGLNTLFYIYTFMLLEEDYYDIQLKLDNINSLIYHYNITKEKTKEINNLEDKCLFLKDNHNCRKFLETKAIKITDKLKKHDFLREEI